MQNVRRTASKYGVTSCLTAASPLHLPITIANYFLNNH
jgi:hypothetical protein